MRTIILVGYARAQILDITGPAQVFQSANEALGRDEYRVVLACVDGHKVETTSGLHLAATPLPYVVPQGADTVLVSGGHGVGRVVKDMGALDWFRRAAKGAKRIGSVCTGTFVLAAAGLLDGRRVATHWDAVADLGRRYPKLQVDGEALYVNDGPVWTSAGVTAGIDMCLALVEADLGREIAMTVARRLVVYARRPGNQTQFSALLEGQAKAGGSFAATVDWMAEHLADSISVRDVADRAGMSERSFHRHFVSEMGDTPARYLERLRLDAARTLLASPELPLKSVAAETGFGSAGRLIQAFERRFGLSPTAYRRLHAG
ncbi:MAG: GlxA family transcriptional regulator [Alphaproteobacteria bacterium]|nr:MAG: GlxA family transcriptional regulator [Alphaproteobacteria bacterium]